MAWNWVNVGQQRVRFVVAANRQEKPLRQLCQEFGISRPTGYVWLERYRQRGLAGMVERSRRPHASPRRTEAAAGIAGGESASLVGRVSVGVQRSESP